MMPSVGARGGSPLCDELTMRLLKMGWEKAFCLGQKRTESFSPDSIAASLVESTKVKVSLRSFTPKANSDDRRLSGK
jgi:hypothetical protein